MNPYEALGLVPGQPLTSDLVEKAHRRARSEAHPDRAGGSAERMTAVNTARDILLNPDRKRRFDELGSLSSGPMTTEEQALMIIGNLFSSAVEKAPDYMKPSQIFVIIAQEISSGRSKALEAQRMHPKRLKRARKLINSMRCAPLMRKALELRIAKLEREINEINQQVEIGNLMLKLMQSVEFTS
jgi:curved DNA-binding protein CbpA